MILKRGPDLDLPEGTIFEAKFDRPFSLPADVAQSVKQMAAKTALRDQGEENPPAADSEKEKSYPQKPVLRTVKREKKPTTDPPLAPSQETPAPPPPVLSGDTESNPSAHPDRPSSVETRTHTEEVLTGSKAKPVNTEAFKLRVQVRMVLVDTVVWDRSGRMIDNLKAEDFHVLEDGQEQRVESYSRDEMPLAVALVIDRSGSVAPYLYELRRIAQCTLDQLKPKDHVALFSFAGEVDRVVDLTADRHKITNGLNRIQSGGGTNIIDALSEAVHYLANAAPDHRRAVILVSDNQATVPSRASEGETIRKAMNTETVIYGIKTGGEAVPFTQRFPNLLSGTGSVTKVTRESGGEIIDAGKVSLLDSALAAVLSRLRLRYSIGYYSSSTERGGAFHSIEVRLSDRFGKMGSDYVIHARRGYYSTGQ